MSSLFFIIIIIFLLKAFHGGQRFTEVFVLCARRSPPPDSWCGGSGRFEIPNLCVHRELC